MQRAPDHVPGEVEITPDLLERLLVAQRPDLHGLPIVTVAEGWDNVLLRVGDALVARMPRRQLAVGLLETELRWQPTLRAGLLRARQGLEVPELVYAGRPGEGYPWPWALQRWIEGRPAGTVGDLPASDAPVLGAWLAALHRLPLPDAPVLNPLRGVPLAERVERLHDRLGRVDLDVRAVLERRRALVTAGGAPERQTWCHGDVHPFNLLVRDGRLAAVIDWGDLHTGDPALDLSAMWLLFPVAAHRAFVEAYGGIDPATASRAAAWALDLGVVLLDAGLQGAGPHFAAVGRRTVARVLGQGR